MESPSQKFDRLLKALDELVTEEEALIHAADYAAIHEVQQRLEPVLVALGALGPEAAVGTARERLGAVLEKRKRNIDTLGDRLAAARAEIDSLQQSTRRVARIAPAYGRAEGGTGPTQLNTSG